MVDKKGLLQGLEMSEVQMALMIARDAIAYDRDTKKAQSEFERDLFVNNPQLHHELYGKKQQQHHSFDEEDGVEWKVPESPEEAAEIAELFEKHALQGSSNTGVVFDEWVGDTED